ncbi:MAG: M28 family peptidase [Anaerolineae bacterium]|nr:M28 family peptidase [Anaerolineae bacterium]
MGNKNVVRLIGILTITLVLFAAWLVLFTGANASTMTAVTPVSSQAPTLAPTLIPTPIPVFSGDEAFAHVMQQMSIGPRIAGTDESREVEQYILGTLDAFVWNTEVQVFIYQGVECHNLIAKSGDGESPILIGAHYDTRRFADHDQENPDLPVPGANDGASGVAVLLELARVVDLSALGSDLWLVFFDAEDNGHIDGWEFIAGSSYFADSMEVTPSQVLIVDMIGDADQQIYIDNNSDPVLSVSLWDIAARLGYGSHFIASPKYSMLDDHTPFAALGIPAVDIIDFDYPYWHTTQDTVDKISSDSLERVGRVLEEYLESGGEYTGGQ